uniref:Coiled-coil domain containing 137 n=1 Tax=Malurus cyaneus samueli TaxID=2593467 RepID=A0A8C5U7X0_9PASS
VSRSPPRVRSRSLPVPVSRSPAVPRSVSHSNPAILPCLDPGVPWCPGVLPCPGARVAASRKEKKDNMKPKHPDEQEIPFRLRELMRSREAMKRPDPGKKQRVAEKKQQQKPKGPKAPGDIAVPKFRRGKGESERSYICRMEHEVQRVLFHTENQLQREPEKEAPEKSKRKKEGGGCWNGASRGSPPDLALASLADTVPFGEVVTQPPTITSRPRGQGPAKQAGRKQLLLTPRLGRSRASLASPLSPVSPVMSMARRRILEEERVRVIQAYRDIQRRKQLERERARAGHGDSH